MDPSHPPHKESAQRTPGRSKSRGSKARMDSGISQEMRPRVLTSVGQISEPVTLSSPSLDALGQVHRDGGGGWVAAGGQCPRAGDCHGPADGTWSEALNNTGFFQQVCLLIKPASHSPCKMQAPHLKAYNLPTRRRTEVSIQTLPPTTALRY